MNEQQLKQLLAAQVNNSAPDKDTLWEKIEGRLQQKSAAPMQLPVNHPKKGSHSVVKILAAVAACFAVVLAVPALLSDNIGGNIMEDSAAGVNSADVTSSVDEMLNSPSADSASDNVATVPVKEFLSYSELPFSSYSETIISCTGEPYGSDYFVEEDILAQADLLVRGEVTRVYAAEDGESIFYELSVSESYPEGETAVTVQSCSQYKLRRGREYLLPLARTPQGYRTVQDSVPQTEFTADGGAVYYNGWSSLLTEHSQPLEYPTQGEEDYFHDRMMFSPTGDISLLVKKWLDMKGSKS